MTLVDAQIRDNRTVGALLPEARTVLFKLGDTSDMIEHIATGKRFVAMASKKTVGLFPIDSISSVVPDPNISMSNKKATTSVLGASTCKPLGVVHAKEDIRRVSLSEDNSMMFISTESGLHAVNLTLSELKIVPVLELKKIDVGILYGDKYVVACKNEVETYSITSGDKIGSSRKFGSGSGEWIGSASENLVALARGSDTVVLMQLGEDEGCWDCKLPSQSGEVSSVHALPFGSINGSPVFESHAVVVAQREVISVFVMKDHELELVFQFRDAINKLTFSAVDCSGQFLSAISSESFSGRDRLELFDLSFLKPKSAGLSPLRRWDISRLTADVDGVRSFFIKRDLLSFIVTGADGTASLWEPVVKDQWFSVMTNFEALNRNQPYQETEEEFDFNQNEDMSVVKRTINRYRRTERTVFDFVPEQDVRGALRDPDVMMEEGANKTADRIKEPVFPFLQPLSSWRTPSSDVPVSAVLGNPEVKFFSETAKSLLDSAVVKARGI
jgi:hypothetical protein